LNKKPFRLRAEFDPTWINDFAPLVLWDLTDFICPALQTGLIYSALLAFGRFSFELLYNKSALRATVIFSQQKNLFPATCNQKDFQLPASNFQSLHALSYISQKTRNLQKSKLEQSPGPA
jgi:hypothetical protein